MMRRVTRLSPGGHYVYSDGLQRGSRPTDSVADGSDWWKRCRRTDCGGMRGRAFVEKWQFTAQRAHFDDRTLVVLKVKPESKTEVVQRNETGREHIIIARASIPPVQSTPCSPTPESSAKAFFRHRGACEKSRQTATVL